MFDLSWTELLVIAVVAIIFIGPKELPAALRTLGRWAGKARGMAREFQNSVDDMIRESELDELRKEVRKIESGEYEREMFDTGISNATAGLRGTEKLDAALRFIVEYQQSYSGVRIIDIEPEVVIAQLSHVLPVMRARLLKLLSIDSSFARSNTEPAEAPSNPSSTRALSCSVCRRPINHVPALASPL